MSPAPMDKNRSKGNLRISLPSINENNHDASLDVSHSYTIQYHNNPVSMDPMYSSPLYKQRRKNQISITDKVSEAQHDQSQEKSDKRPQKFEKMVMKTAAAYQHASPERKLYLPTLIKAVELDKKLKIVTNKTRLANPLMLSIERGGKTPSMKELQTQSRETRNESDQQSSYRRVSQLD